MMEEREGEKEEKKKITMGDLDGMDEEKGEKEPESKEENQRWEAKG